MTIMNKNEECFDVHWCSVYRKISENTSKSLMFAGRASWRMWRPCRSAPGRWQKPVQRHILKLPWLLDSFFFRFCIERYIEEELNVVEINFKADAEAWKLEKNTVDSARKCIWGIVNVPANREPDMNRREVLEHLFCFCGAQITLSGTLNFKAGECEAAVSFQSISFIPNLPKSCWIRSQELGKRLGKDMKAVKAGVILLFVLAV